MNDSDCPRGVLIIDDDLAVREALAEALEDAEYCPIAAANGQEALEYLRQGGRPCVILLDLMMPIMDGWEFRAAQLADPALGPIPVIVLSAVNELGRVAAGVVLRKPVQLATLLEAVQRFCTPQVAS
jgi:CheY-like chemotaxis protein